MTGKYPAKDHARRSVAHLKEFATQANSDIAAGKVEGSLVYLETPDLELWPHCDQTKPIRQDRYFMYFTGCDTIPGCRVTYDIKNDNLTLYLPPIDYDDVMWSGMPMSLAKAKESYDVDEVKYSTDLPKDFGGYNVIGIEKSKSFDQVQECLALKEAIEEARMVKDDYEIELMRTASKITDNSHLAVMSALPIEKEEGHIHAEFVYHAMRQGSKFQAYDPICCSGTDCGTLHYVKNDQPLDDKQLVLIDAGAEWKTYAADVTRVFPISGKWTEEARAIYDAVFDMQKQCMEMVKPGAHWDDLHKHAHRVMIQRLKKLGLLQGDDEEIFQSKVTTALMPHGLGHLLGMSTHDCGGRPNYEDADPMLKYLRLRRTLQKNMMVTVEPGIYFNKFLLEPVMDSKFLNKEVLERYMSVGGVRIEDDVLVTADGWENLTQITKDADEVAKIVSDGIAKGRSHFHNVV